MEKGNDGFDISVWCIGKWRVVSCSHKRDLNDEMSRYSTGSPEDWSISNEPKNIEHKEQASRRFVEPNQHVSGWSW